MKYLVNIKDGNDEKYNMLTDRNSKFLFYHFNDYVRQISDQTKPVRHSVVLNDVTALEILQNKDWQYFIEIILEVCQSNNGGEFTKLVNAKEVQIIKNSVENLTFCKSLYKKFHNQVSENLAEALWNLWMNDLEEIDRYLEQNYFFIDFDSMTNQEEIMNATAIFIIGVIFLEGKIWS